ncbi:MAG TPA: hypothetical protein VI160_02335 [Gemmatimonadales bacterium]
MRFFIDMNRLFDRAALLVTAILVVVGLWHASASGDAFHRPIDPHAW